MKLFLPLLLALGGCSESPKLQVKVTDVWNNPIAGATLFQEGVLERPTTGSDGAVTLEVEPGDHSFMAGKEGYIKELATTSVAPVDSTESMLPNGFPFLLFELFWPIDCIIFCMAAMSITWVSPSL